MEFLQKLYATNTRIQTHWNLSLQQQQTSYKLKKHKASNACYGKLHRTTIENERQSNAGRPSIFFPCFPIKMFVRVSYPEANVTLCHGVLRSLARMHCGPTLTQFVVLQCIWGEYTNGHCQASFLATTTPWNHNPFTIRCPQVHGRIYTIGTRYECFQKVERVRTHKQLKQTPKTCRRIGGILRAGMSRMSSIHER